MRTHPRLRTLFALLAVLGLTLAFVACGGDDSTNSSSTSGERAPPARPTT